MSRSRAHVFVSGRVQGVWFRESTRRRADELGLRGWVRNLPDGRVEALFEGDSSAVRLAVEYVREGPAHARVDHVDVVDDLDEPGRGSDRQSDRRADPQADRQADAIPGEPFQVR